MEYNFWNFSEQTGDKERLFRLYHENSKHSPRTQCFNVPRNHYDTGIDLEEKQYPTIYQIPCLEDLRDDGYSLYDALLLRRTSWKFIREALTDKEIEKLIAYSFGISNKEQNLKTYPSGGRMYPVEIYIIPGYKIINQSRIFPEDKVYRYNIHTRNIEVIGDGDVKKLDSLISSTDIGGMTFAQAQFLICLVGNYKVMAKKYHSLTYRLMQNELGHIGQNLMLAATMLKVNSVPLGGFFEERINSYLMLDGTSKTNMYTFALG